MTAADEIKAAASTLRALAAAATLGPWRYNPARQWQAPPGDLGAFEPGEEYVAAGPAVAVAVICVAATGPADDPESIADAAYIATVHPQVGAAVAAWLESWTGIDLAEDAPLPTDAEHALAVARAINQGETRDAPSGGG